MNQLTRHFDRLVTINTLLRVYVPCEQPTQMYTYMYTYMYHQIDWFHFPKEKGKNLKNVPSLCSRVVITTSLRDKGQNTVKIHYM